MKLTAKHIIAAATALTIGAASFSVYAANSQTANQPASSKAAKIAAFQQSRVSAAQAASIAQGSVPGKATGVDFEYKNGQSVYEVEVQSGDQEYEVRIDANSGSILDKRLDNGDHDKDGKHHGKKEHKEHKDHEGKENRVKPQANISLQQAIAAAEAKTGGKTKEADLKSKKGQAVYKIETVNGTQKYEVRVNADNGQVMDSKADN